MSNEFQLFLTILTVLSGVGLNWWSGRTKLMELKQAQKEWEEKLKLDKKQKDADLSEQFLGIAEESGKQVITRDATIKELQGALKDQQDTLKKQQISIDNLQEQVTSLLADKRKLEDDNIRKDERISALETDNTKLRDRIQALETELKGVKGDC